MSLSAGSGRSSFPRGCRSGPGRQPQPGGEVASRLENAEIGNARGDRRGGQRADARNAIEQPGRLAAGGGLGDFTLGGVDRSRERFDMEREQLRHLSGLWRQRRVVLRQFTQFLDPADALGDDEAERREVAAQRIDAHRALLDQQFPSLVLHQHQPAGPRS